MDSFIRKKGNTMDSKKVYALLLAVEEMTGKTDAFLKAYCDAFAFQIASREDFITLLNRVTQEDMEPLAADYLDTLMQ